MAARLSCCDTGLLVNPLSKQTEDAIAKGGVHLLGIATSSTTHAFSQHKPVPWSEETIRLKVSEAS